MNNQGDSSSLQTARQAAMRGFDAEFTDIVDYILRITERIWEGKQVELCRKYYSDDCPVYALGGMTVGAEEVTQNTYNTLAAFPDRTLHGDNVIWGGNDIDGFHSSHLITTRMTNLGDSEFGPASGKHAKIQVIAHCICKDNKVIEEWLVRDNYSLVEQLGFDPHAIAQQFASKPMQERFQQWYQQELARVSQSQNSKLDTLEGNQSLLCTALNNIWNAGKIAEVNRIYTEKAKVHASAKRQLEGHQEISDFYSSFLKTFSELRVALDYSCEIANDSGGSDVAVRWTMTGNHTGSDLFGEPTGAPILIIGESHYRVVDGRIQEEWTVFDQLAILTQIYRARKS